LFAYLQKYSEAEMTVIVDFLSSANKIVSNEIRRLREE
jgi:hypothetical protein